MFRFTRFFKILLILPLLTRGQAIQVKNIEDVEKNGIHFESELTWQQAKDKARSENKYIFVDCFATWCKPCRYMDENVYSKEAVGTSIDSHFISIKVQMDTSKLDNEGIRNWYADAHRVQQEYEVAAFPTYLFFSPEGKIVHKGSGAQTVEEFMNLAKNALNPDKQYYTLLERYRSGRININFMPYLARTAKRINETKFANTVARTYFENYLFTLNEDELCTRKNLQFIYEFNQILRSGDKCFDLFCNHGDKVDSSMGLKGAAMSVSNIIITREYITPMLEKAYASKSAPEWPKIFRSMKKKYGVEHAERNLLSAKVKYYEHEGNLRRSTAFFVEEVEKYGVGNTLIDFFLNNNAWYVFEHSVKKSDLKKALSWSERAIQICDKPMASYIDTKANLLYKLGRKMDALSIEEIAVKLDPSENSIKENFEKMKKNIPTWPSE